MKGTEKDEKMARTKDEGVEHLSRNWRLGKTSNERKDKKETGTLRGRKQTSDEREGRGEEKDKGWGEPADFGVLIRKTYCSPGRDRPRETRRS